ncbi:MAG: hypothetical protein ACR2IV_10335, partial [Bryobacteraceae bacterium]
LYSYACLKPPRTCVRRASGLVLTRHSERIVESGRPTGHYKPKTLAHDLTRLTVAAPEVGRHA